MFWKEANVNTFPSFQNIYFVASLIYISTAFSIILATDTLL